MYELQVIWALGCSMVILAGLVYLPRALIAAFAVLLIVGHNLFDGLRAEDLKAWGPRTRGPRSSPRGVTSVAFKPSPIMDLTG